MTPIAALSIAVAVVGALSVAAYYAIRLWRARRKGGRRLPEVRLGPLTVAPLTFSDRPSAGAMSDGGSMPSVEMGSLTTLPACPWRRLEDE